jgi:hypothetical protein
MRCVQIVLMGVAVAASIGLVACDQLAGTSEGKAWTIATQESADGPVMTLKMKSTLEDDQTGKQFPMEIEVSGQGGSEWAGGMAHQSLSIKLACIGGPPMPDEESLEFVPDGNKRNPFGGGDPGSEVRQVDGKSVNCSTFTAHGPASAVRTLVGSRFVNASVGRLKFYLEDEQVRAMAELLRRLDASVPK